MGGKVCLMSTTVFLKYPPANNLNFHWRWRWWDRIQAIFFNLFYFTKKKMTFHQTFHHLIFFDMKCMQFKIGNDKKEPNASKMIRVSSLPRGPSLLPTVIVGHFTLYTETMVWKLLKNSVHITFGLPFVHTSAYTCIPHIVTLRFLLYVLVLLYVLS